MTIESIIETTKKLQGNLSRGNGIYISSKNMICFTNLLNKTDKMRGILITPYLITKNGALYELHYYEFDIEVRKEQSHYNNYDSKNLLPIEVIENLKPQAIVAEGDIDFYRKCIASYLENMKNLDFNEIKTYYPELLNAQLFYQIF